MSLTISDKFKTYITNYNVKLPYINYNIKINIKISRTYIFVTLRSHGYNVKRQPK